MAEEPRQASQDDQGKSTETSDDAGKTKTEDGGAFKFDLNAKYQDPNDPEKEISGIELKAAINRGTMFDKAQSERDKARQETEKLVADNEKLHTELEKVTAMAEQALRKQETLQTLKEAGLQTKQAAEYDPYGDDEKPTIDPEDVNRRVESIAETRFSQGVEELDKRAAAREQERETKYQIAQETQKEIDDFVARGRATSIQTYTADYPDIDSKRIEEVVNLNTLASVRDYQAREAITRGDTATADQAHLEAEASRVAGLRKLREIDREQDAITTKRQEEAEIESLSAGAVLEPFQKQGRARGVKASLAKTKLMLKEADRVGKIRQRADNR